MPARRSDDEINELLKLAGVSTRDPEARAWVEGALVASRALAAQEPRPSPAKHNAPLNAIERAADRLITALIALRRHHPHAHGDFWRSATFGPVRDANFEAPTVDGHREKHPPRGVQGAHDPNRSPPGLPQTARCKPGARIWARFSPERPSSDPKNQFVDFASVFYERATGLSIEGKGHGIERQIKVALRRLPIEVQRATLLHVSRSKTA